MTPAEAIGYLTEELKLLASRRFRGKDGKDRILRNLMEELGEYAEAVEYSLGSSDKMRKFDGKVTPAEKLREESLNLLMLAFAAVRAEDINIVEACQMVADQLKRKRGANS